MNIYLFKIKKGRERLWRDWCSRIDTELRKEALATLEEEGLSYEAFGIFSINGELYTLGLAEGEAKIANVDKAINQRHQALKKACLEKLGKVEMLYELSLKKRL